MPTSGMICTDAGTSVPLHQNDGPDVLEMGPDGIERAGGVGHQPPSGQGAAPFEHRQHPPIEHQLPGPDTAQCNIS